MLPYGLPEKRTKTMHIEKPLHILPWLGEIAGTTPCVHIGKDKKAPRSEDPAEFCKGLTAVGCKRENAFAENAVKCGVPERHLFAMPLTKLSPADREYS